MPGAYLGRSHFNVLRRAGSQWGWAGALVAGALIAIFAGPKAQPKAPPSAAADAPVLAADEALGEAMRAGDKAIARRLLSLQFTFVDADGKIHVTQGFSCRSQRLSPPRPQATRMCRLYGLLAMVTGHRKSAHGEDALFLDIWARQKGRGGSLVMQDVAIAAAEAPAAAASTAAGRRPSRTNAKIPARQSPIACALRPNRTSSIHSR